MTQPNLFGQLDPIKLRAGTEKCPCCGKLMRAYAKTLDKRLIDLLFDACWYMTDNKGMTFNPRIVWKDDHQKINDFQKLGYWKLIQRTKSAGHWKITDKGWNFTAGQIQLPRRVWVFNRQVILEDDEMVRVNHADPRWQTTRADYTMDYIPQAPKIYQHEKI